MPMLPNGATADEEEVIDNFLNIYCAFTERCEPPMPRHNVESTPPRRTKGAIAVTSPPVAFGGWHVPQPPSTPILKETQYFSIADADDATELEHYAATISYEVVDEEPEVLEMDVASEAEAGGEPEAVEGVDGVARNLCSLFDDEANDEDAEPCLPSGEMLPELPTFNTFQLADAANVKSASGSAEAGWRPEAHAKTHLEDTATPRTCNDADMGDSRPLFDEAGVPAVTTNASWMQLAGAANLQHALRHNYSFSYLNYESDHCVGTAPSLQADAASIKGPEAHAKTHLEDTATPRTCNDADMGTAPSLQADAASIKCAGGSAEAGGGPEAHANNHLELAATPRTYSSAVTGTVPFLRADAASEKCATGSAEAGWRPEALANNHPEDAAKPKTCSGAETGTVPLSLVDATSETSDRGSAEAGWRPEAQAHALREEAKRAVILAYNSGETDQDNLTMIALEVLESVIMSERQLFDLQEEVRAAICEKIGTSATVTEDDSDSSCTDLADVLYKSDSEASASDEPLPLHFKTRWHELIDPSSDEEESSQQPESAEHMLGAEIGTELKAAQTLYENLVGRLTVDPRSTEIAMLEAELKAAQAQYERLVGTRMVEPPRAR
jgi:hypothetical protein